MAVNLSRPSPLSSPSPSLHRSLRLRPPLSLLSPAPFPIDLSRPRYASVRSHSQIHSPDPLGFSFADGFGSKRPIDSDRNIAPPFASPISSSSPSSSSSSSSSVIDFLTLCNRLKTTKRKGWVNNGIKGPESIADHMYRMALMALIADDLPGLNRERCIKIAIVHDIAEAIVGDITPSDGVPKEEKSRRELAALNEMCEVLGGGMRAEEIKELWAEYENNSSLEANLVKDFDKVELILQALEYEMEHGRVLDEFFISTAGKFQTDIGKSWAAEIICRRNSRLANKRS